MVLSRQDERVLHLLVQRRRVTIDRLMRWVTHLGDAWFAIGLVAFWCSGAVPELQTVGYRSAFILVVSHLGVQLLKRTVSRPRPSLPVGCSTLIHAPDRFSFPSGHAAAALSIGLPLLSAVQPVIGGLLLSTALVVGMSRCYLGVHYPGDVVAGWSLALLAAWSAGLLGLG